MSSKSQWSSLKAQLGDGYRCIAVDLQGYGASPFPADAGEDYVHTLAHEVDAVVASIASELEPGEAFHLIGHSFGGACALHMARRMPQRVLSLTLFEPVAFHLLPDTHPAKAEIVGVVGAIHAGASDRDATRTFIDYWNRAGAFDAAPAGAQEKMVSQIAKVKLDFQALLGEPATLDELSMLTMPALVMAGERSPRRRGCWCSSWAYRCRMPPRCRCAQRIWVRSRMARSLIRPSSTSSAAPKSPPNSNEARARRHGRQRRHAAGASRRTAGRHRPGRQRRVGHAGRRVGRPHGAVPAWLCR
ncbi:alpha/beta fold hydrolase [Duganella sp. P38]|uniref:alpha/beta fold hydrolase n=1 Tax=Duganella sp. P38 TaxID=3423949 RepID=UPI003D7B7E93